MVVLTRKQVEEKYNEYVVKNGEISMSKFLRLPKEDGGLGISWATANKFVNTDKKEIRIDYPDRGPTTKEKVELVYDFLKSNDYSKGDVITLEILKDWSKDFDISERALALHVLNIPFENYDAIKRGRLKTTKMFPGNPLEDKYEEETIKLLKTKMTQRKNKEYTLEDIENISKEFKIDKMDLVCNVFGKNKKTLSRLKLGESKSIKFSNFVEKIGYENKTLEAKKVIVEDDLKDMVQTGVEFDYPDTIKTKEELLVEVNKVREKVRDNNQYLREKYDLKLEELYPLLKEVNEKNPERKKIYNDLSDDYLQQLRQAYERHPDYKYRHFNEADLRFLTDDLKCDLKSMAKIVFDTYPCEINRVVGDSKDPYEYRIFNQYPSKRMDENTAKIIIPTLEAQFFKIARYERKKIGMSNLDFRDAISAANIYTIEKMGNLIPKGHDLNEEIDENRIVCNIGGYMRTVIKGSYSKEIKKIKETFINKDLNSDNSKEDKEGLLIDKRSSYDDYDRVDGGSEYTDYEMKILEILGGFSDDFPEEKTREDILKGIYESAQKEGLEISEGELEDTLYSVYSKMGEGRTRDD